MMMPRLLAVTLTASAVTLLAPAAMAVTIVECVDDSGEITFRSFCPPGTVKKSEKQVAGDRQPATVDITLIAAQHPVTLYSAPNCQACDLVRTQLQNRGVPFTELDVAADLTKQEELRSLVGGSGSLTVPVVHLDEDILTGYNQAALDASLNRAGYPPVTAPLASPPLPPATAEQPPIPARAEQQPATAEAPREQGEDSAPVPEPGDESY